jgi:hypothetical protein
VDGHLAMQWCVSVLRSTTRQKVLREIDISRMELTLSRTMRGENTKQSSMLMLMSPETRVPTTHPLRAIKKLADAALGKLSPVFDAMYASTGRPSIPPERLLKSMLLIALYTVRSERSSASSSTTTSCFAGFSTWTYRNRASIRRCSPRTATVWW